MDLNECHFYQKKKLIYFLQHAMVKCALARRVLKIKIKNEKSATNCAPVCVSRGGSRHGERQELRLLRK